MIGRTYENDLLKVPAASYVGLLRYHSPENKNVVQGPFGLMSKSGDFLIEISGVKWRDSILLHGGNKPEHSRGCILLGPVAKNEETHTGHSIIKILHSESSKAASSFSLEHSIHSVYSLRA